MRPLSVSIRKASPCSPQNVERSQTALSTTQVIFILQPFSRAGRARLDIQNGGNGLGRRRSNGPVFHCARPSSALVPGCRYLKQLRSSLFLLLKGMLFYMLIVTSEEMVHHPASLLQVLDPMPEYLIPQGGQAVDAPRRSLCLFPVPRGDHPALLLHLPQRSVDNGGVKGFKAEVPQPLQEHISVGGTMMQEQEQHRFQKPHRPAGAPSPSPSVSAVRHALLLSFYILPYYWLLSICCDGL